MKNWNIFKHTFAALIIALGVNCLWDRITFREAASIGVIGGADGPTSIYISGKVLSAAGNIMLKILALAAYPGIIVFVVLILLFRPIKKLLNRLGSRE